MQTFILYNTTKMALRFLASRPIFPQHKARQICSTAKQHMNKTIDSIKDQMASCDAVHLDSSDTDFVVGRIPSG